MKVIFFALANFLLIYSFPVLLLDGNPNCKLDSAPNNANECNKFNDNINYCCFLSPVENKTANNNDNLCYPIEITKYKGQGTINYSRTTYHVNCGIGSENFSLDSSNVKKCGILNPLKAQQCYDFSTSTNSCCFFNNDGLSGCYYLGVKYFGSTKNENLELSCISNLLRFNYYVMFFLIVLVYNLF
jgi:hypothetical protein